MERRIHLESPRLNNKTGQDEHAFGQPGVVSEGGLLTRRIQIAEKTSEKIKTMEATKNLQASRAVADATNQQDEDDGGQLNRLEEGTRP